MMSRAKSRLPLSDRPVRTPASAELPPLWRCVRRQALAHRLTGGGRTTAEPISWLPVVVLLAPDRPEPLDMAAMKGLTPTCSATPLADDRFTPSSAEWLRALGKRAPTDCRVPE